MTRQTQWLGMMTRQVRDTRHATTGNDRSGTRDFRCATTGNDRRLTPVIRCVPSWTPWLRLTCQTRQPETTCQAQDTRDAKYLWCNDRKRHVRHAISVTRRPEATFQVYNVRNVVTGNKSIHAIYWWHNDRQTGDKRGNDMSDAWRHWTDKRDWHVKIDDGTCHVSRKTSVTRRLDSTRLTPDIHDALTEIDMWNASHLRRNCRKRHMTSWPDTTSRTCDIRDATTWHERNDACHQWHDERDWYARNDDRKPQGRHERPETTSHKRDIRDTTGTSVTRRMTSLTWQLGLTCQTRQSEKTCEIRDFRAATPETCDTATGNDMPDRWHSWDDRKRYVRNVTSFTQRRETTC